MVASTVSALEAAENCTDMTQARVWCQGRLLAGNETLGALGISSLAYFRHVLLPVLGGGIIGKEARNRLLAILQMSGKLDKAQSGLDALIHQVEPAKLKKLAEAKTTTARDLLNLANTCSPPIAFSASFRTDSTRPSRASSADKGKGKATGKGNSKGFDKSSGKALGKGNGKGGDANAPVTIDAAGLGNVHVLQTLKRSGSPCATGVFLAEARAAEDIVRELRDDPWPAPLAILVTGHPQDDREALADSQLLATGTEVAVPTCQGARKLMRKMVAFQVGSAALNIPSPTVFDLEDEFESYQTWNMQVRQLWAPSEIWQACCAPQPSQAFGGLDGKSLRLPTCPSSSRPCCLPSSSSRRAPTWRHGVGASTGMQMDIAGCIDSLIRVPRQYEEALRRGVRS